MNVNHELVPPISGTVKYIIHLSDIHIHIGNRKESRYNEYLTVFNKLFLKLKEYPKDITDSLIIIITGDFFHVKNRIDAYSSILFNYLLVNLGKIAPTFIIQGNHDYRQDYGTDSFDEDNSLFQNNLLQNNPGEKNPSEKNITSNKSCPDILTSLFYGTVRENVTYLEKTGCYIIGNVGLGLVSVKDSLIPGDTCGAYSAKDLPEFPNNFPPSVNIKIALFHGTIVNTKYDLFTNSGSKGYPIDWIKGYDLWMLGDIHLQQIYNAYPTNSNIYTWNNEGKPVWAYSGSLIQQTFGETVSNHGYLFWNLEEKLVETVDIPNDYGKVTLKFGNSNNNNNNNNCQWLIKNEGKWFTPYKERNTTIHNLWLEGKLPCHIQFKTEGKYDNQSIDKLEEELKQYNLKSYTITRGKVFSNIFKNNNDNDSNDQDTNNTVIEFQSYNTPDSWINYIKEKYNNDIELTNCPWEIWLKSLDTAAISINTDGNSLPDFLKLRLNEKNKDFLKEVDKFNLSLNKTTLKQKITLLYIEWNWIFGYADSNWFDFTSAINHICEIKGDNSSGKSSFYEIICLALFGKGIPKRAQRLLGIICSSKPNGSGSGSGNKNNANITLKFQIKTDQYYIIREYKEDKDNKDKDNKDKDKCTLFSKLYKWDTLKNNYILLKSGNPAVATWVDENIGSLEQFLLSIMITQGCDEDFFSQDSIKQMAFLDRALDIEVVTRLKNILHISSNIHSSFYKDLRDYDNSITIKPFNPDHLTDVYKQHTAIIDSIKEKELILDSLHFSQDLCEPLNNLSESFIDDKYNTVVSNLSQLRLSNNLSYESILTKLNKYKSIKESFLPLDEFNDDSNNVNDNDNDTNYGNDYDSRLNSLILKLKDLDLTKPHKTLQELTSSLQSYSDVDSNLLTSANTGINELNLLKKDELNLLTQLETINKTMNQYLNERPNKPHLTNDDVNSAELAFNPSVRNELTDLKTELSNHDTELPTLEQIDEYINTINKNLTNLPESNWINLSDIDLIEQADTIYDNIHKAEILIANKLKEKESINNEIQLINLQIHEIEELIKSNNINNKIETNDYSLNVINNWLTTYNDKKLIYDTKSALFNKYTILNNETDKLKSLNQEKDLLHGRLLECSDVEYNDNCSACMKNPGRLLKINLLNKINELNTSIDKTNNYISDINNIIKSINNSCSDSSNSDGSSGDGSSDSNSDGSSDSSSRDNSYETLKRWMDIFNNDVKEESIWLTRLDKALKTEKINKERDANNNMLNELRKEIILLNQVVQDLTLELQNLKNNLEETKNLHNSIILYKENRLMWKQQLTEYNKIKMKVLAFPDRAEKLNRLKIIQDIQAKFELALSQKEIIKAYNEWSISFCTVESRAKIVEADLSHVRQNISLLTRVNEFMEIKEEYRICKEWYHQNHKYKKQIINLAVYLEDIANSDLITYKQIQALEKEEKYWSLLQTLKPRWEQKKIILEDLKYLRLLGEKLAIKTAELQKLKDESVTNSIIKNYNKIALDLLEKRKNALNHLEFLFSLYKNHIYKNVVIPKLVSITNDLANSLLKSGQELKCEFLDDNLEKKMLHWSIIGDGGRVSSIQRSGGYSSFVFGLLIRIAISSLGVSNLTSNQLFIDEGFVSGSAKSLEDVPEFLNHLKNLYNSIFLVTHTDVLKETATMSCNLNKNKTFIHLSQFQIGDKQEFEIVDTAIAANVVIDAHCQDDNQNIAKDKIIKPKIGKKIIKNNDNDNSDVTNNNICKTLTKKGLQCKNKCLADKDFCKLHFNQLATDTE